MASLTCSGRMVSADSKSAMVRETFRIRSLGDNAVSDVWPSSARCRLFSRLCENVHVEVSSPAKRVLELRLSFLPRAHWPRPGIPPPALRCADRSDPAKVRKSADDTAEPAPGCTGTPVSNRQSNRTDTDSSPPPA